MPVKGFCAMSSGIRPKESDIVPRSDVVGVNMMKDRAIHQRRRRCAEGSDEVPDEPMTCRTA